MNLTRWVFTFISENTGLLINQLITQPQQNPEIIITKSTSTFSLKTLLESKQGKWMFDLIHLEVNIWLLILNK